MDVLAIGAHPDDIDIGAGGLLLLTNLKGRSAAAVDLTAGECGTRGDADVRAREAAAAGRRLGLRWRRCLDLPDAALRDDDRSRRALIAVLREARPALIVGPDPDDPHPDHRAAAELVAAAWFLAGLGRHAPELGAPHRAPRRVTMAVRPAHRPDLLLPIDAVWPDKREALARHASQMAPDATHRLGADDPLAEAEAVARTLGMLAGCTYAEGFRCPDPWVVDDLVPGSR